jgi:hypothetical protein
MSKNEDRKKRKAEVPHVLSPDEAVRRLQDDPDTLFWRIADFLTQFGYAWHEILPELQAGRLLAARSHGSTSTDDALITAGAYMRWISHPNTPAHLRTRLGEKRPLPS